MPEFRRGDIWFFDPNPTRGHEQKRQRPCLIVSVDAFNNGASDLLIILPLTTKKKSIPCHIEVKAEGLKQTSYIMCDQIRTISKERLMCPSSRSKRTQPIATVSPKVLQDIKKWLSLLLGFNLI